MSSMESPAPSKRQQTDDQGDETSQTANKRSMLSKTQDNSNTIETQTRARSSINQPYIILQQPKIIQGDPDAAYTRLEADEVRFLKLIRETYRKDFNRSPIELSFHIESTKNPHVEPYEALSYVWGGSPSDGKYTVRVWQESFTCVEVPVTSNLYFALLALRNSLTPRRLWADALCINQRDDVERCQQVAEMGWIYRHASNVLIMLMCDPPCSSGAAQCIERMLTFETSGTRSISKRGREQLLATSALFACTWFSRRWVVQEVSLARNATVIVPSFEAKCVRNWEMPWEDFADAITLFSRRMPGIMAQLSPEDAFGFGETHALGARSLVEIANNLHRKDSQGHFMENLLGLEDLLTMVPMFDTTHIHDAVYAILGLAKNSVSGPNRSRPPIPIDYSMTAAALFAIVVRYIITESRSLDILCRPWAPSNATLPSWVATMETYPYARRSDGQYHRKYGDALVGSTKANSNVYHASSSENYNNQIEVRITTDEVLVVDGYHIDSINYIGERSINGNIPATWLTIAGWQDVESECPAGFWQTVVADRGPSGENAPNWYRRACQHIYRKTGKVDLDTSRMIECSHSDDADFLRRMQSIVWGRVFFKTRRDRLGLGPPACEKGDIVAILRACSVPVVLRLIGTTTDGLEIQHYKLVGECYVQGCMDGEVGDNTASDECLETPVRCALV